MNELAETSRWLGICAVVPYLLFGILPYVEKRMGDSAFHVGNILALFCSFWGVLLGSITVIIGIVAIRQINNSESTEKGIPWAVLGITLSLLAIIINLRFIATVFYQILFA